MKTKILIRLMTLVMLFAFLSCVPFDQKNAEILIRTRVPKCTNVSKVENNFFAGKRYYAAVDSFYHIYFFSIDKSGIIEEIKKK